MANSNMPPSPYQYEQRATNRARLAYTDMVGSEASSGPPGLPHSHISYANMPLELEAAAPRAKRISDIKPVDPAKQTDAPFYPNWNGSDRLEDSFQGGVPYDRGTRI